VAHPRQWLRNAALRACEDSQGEFHLGGGEPAWNRQHLAAERLAWEAADPYLYMRFTADQRIIIGGADEDILDASERDRKIPEKTRNLLGQFQDIRVVPVSVRPDYSWAGLFGTTIDGLPLIGRLPGHRNVFAAFGYGGNGITFSALAARLITDLIGAGTTSPLLESMAIDR
jgi:glycine/D-amino acid oxidase-like deaminating enzyme